MTTQSRAITAPPPFGPPNPEDFVAFETAINGWVLARCLSAVADLKVADALGNEPQSAAQLAAKTGADPDILWRVLRILAANGIFENNKGLFRHKGFSVYLRSDHPASASASVSMITDAWPLFGALDHALRTGRPAAEQAVGGNFWTYLSANPEIAKRFDAGMTSKAHSQIAEIMAAYDFSPYASIADIGGGRGHFINTVLAAYPKAKGALFDLPQVINALGKAASERLERHAGDFFKDKLPVCDAYLMMNVIHDWNDAESVALLQNVRKHAKPGAKLLIVESPLREDDGPHPALINDIIMLVFATGRERKASEYKALIERAGWRLDRVVNGQQGMVVFEAVPA